MLDADQQRMLATWVNKNSKRLNDRVAKSRSQADFRAVLAEATEYFNQLHSERATHAQALDDALQSLERGPANEQGEAWAATEKELRRDAEIRQQVIAEFDRHITACEALIAWVQGQLASAVGDDVAVASAPTATGQLPSAPNLRRMLVIGAGVLGIILAVWLLFSLVRGPQSAAVKPPDATPARPATSQPAQALTPGASPAALSQATPLGAGNASPTPRVVAAAAETTQATRAPARPSKTPTARPSPTRTPAPSSTATSMTPATQAPTSTPTATRTPAPTATRTPAPTATRTLAPTSTAVPTTAVPTATAIPATAVSAATATRAPARATTSPAAAATRLPPSPAPAPASPNVPVPLEPRADETRRGDVKFVWQAGGPLPSGAAYEVVWWNDGEDPATARGIAATTTETSLTANLDPLYASAQLRSTRFYWTVIVVQTSPYVRLTQPAQSALQRLNYASSSGESQPAPPKP